MARTGGLAVGTWWRSGRGSYSQGAGSGAEVHHDHPHNVGRALRNWVYRGR